MVKVDVIEGTVNDVLWYHYSDPAPVRSFCHVPWIEPVLSD
jgi:hypothetical protein